MQKLSNRSLAKISEAFAHGRGPSHSDIDRIFLSSSGENYLPSEGNKAQRVLLGLRSLRDGLPDHDPPLVPDAEKLLGVAEALCAEIVSGIDGVAGHDGLRETLAADGYTLDSSGFAESKVGVAPADRIADHVVRLLREDPDLSVALTHYEQAIRAFARRDYEAANAQYRSALDAVFDVLAYRKGCSRTGGAARKWLADHGHLKDDESELLSAVGKFAGRAGSHAGVSDAVDSQLRRHMVTASITFGVAKLG